MSQPAKPAAPTDAAAAAAASSMQQPRKGNSKRPIAAEAAGASNEDRPAKAAKPHAAASVGSDEFSQLTVTVLKGRCQQLGLPVTGNKATLIARLKEEDREFEETAEEVEELPQNSFGDTEEDIWEYKFDPKNMLSVLNIDVLRQKCRDIGLLTGEGNVVPVKQLSKEQLHAALRLWSNVRTLPPGNLFDPLVRINDMLVEEAESNPELAAYLDPMLLTILNWGAYGPEGAAACVGLAASATPPANVLHAHCPGGPNPPGSAANPTLLPGGDPQPLPGGGDDGGVNLTWQATLQEILHTVLAASGKKQHDFAALGAADSAIAFQAGDPTRLQVNLAPALGDAVFQAIKVALGRHSRIERINFEGGVLVL